MSSATSIEWTGRTWNPVVGCSRVSDGCRNCYAEKMASRLAIMGQGPYKGLTTSLGQKARWTGAVRCLPDRLTTPLKWRKGRRIFVNSMSDVFHEKVPFSFISAVFGVIAATPQHSYQLLTKRPQRALKFLEWYEGTSGAGARPWPTNKENFRGFPNMPGTTTLVRTP